MHTKRVMIMILVMILMVTACKSAEKPVTDIPAEMPGAPDTEKAEGDGSSGTENDPPTEQVTGPVEADYVLVNRLEGGIFYHNAAQYDAETSKLRSDALAQFREELLIMTDSAVSMTRNGLDSYSDYIIQMGGQSGLKQDEYAAMVQETTALRGAVEALVLEIEGYRQIEADSPELQAVFDRNLLESALKLRKLAALYDTYSVKWKDYTVAMLADIDVEAAKQFQDHCNAIYEDQVAGEHAKVIVAYLRAVNIYGHISSADYAVAYNRLEDSLKKVEAMAPSEDVTAVKTSIQKAMEQDIPPYMISVDALTHENQQQFSLADLFCLTVHADGVSYDSNRLNKILALGGLKAIPNDQQTLDMMMFQILSGGAMSNYFYDEYEYNPPEVSTQAVPEPTTVPPTTSAVNDSTQTTADGSDTSYEGLDQAVRQEVQHVWVKGWTEEKVMDRVIKDFIDNAPTDIYAEEILDQESADDSALEKNASKQLQQLNDKVDSMEAHNGDLDEELFSELIADIADAFEEELGAEKNNFKNHCINAGMDKVFSDLSIWAANNFSPGSINLNEESLTELFAAIGIKKSGLDQEMIDRVAEQFDIGDSPTVEDVETGDGLTAVILPSTFYASETVKNILMNSVLNGIDYEESVIDDNYTALIMSDEDRKEAVSNITYVLDEMENVDNSDEEDPYLLAVNVSDDYMGLDIYLADRKKRMFEGMGVSFTGGVFGIYSMIYQLFEQVAYEDVMLKVRTLNNATGAVIESEEYSPKAKEIAEKVEEVLVAESYKDRLTTSVRAPYEDQYRPSGGESFDITARNSTEVEKVAVFKPDGSGGYLKTVYTYNMDTGKLKSLSQGCVDASDYEKFKSYDSDKYWKHRDRTFVNHGYACAFNADGFLTSETNYDNGNQNGYRSFHDNGSLRWTVPYENGVQHGTEYHYDENGHLEEALEYENDEKIRRVEFDPDGTVSDIN